MPDVCNLSYKKMACFHSRVCQIIPFPPAPTSSFLFSTQTIVVHGTGHCIDESLVKARNNDVEKLNIAF